MNFPSSLIKNAVEAISNFPGIGKKTALRLAIYLLRNKKQAHNISESIKKEIKTLSVSLKILEILLQLKILCNIKVIIMC